MFGFNWLRRFRDPRPQRPAPRRRFQPRFEALERRDTPTTGLLDTTFGNQGITIAALDLGGANSDAATDVAVQPDGKIVVVGVTELGAGDFDFAVLRYNRDGSRDTTFGQNGAAIVAFNLGGTDFDDASAVALQADGKIVVAGTAAVGGGNRFAVCRLEANGALDTSFNGDGKVTVAFPSADFSIARDVAVQPDGKIVVVGKASTGADSVVAVCRFNASGALDLSFGVLGKQTVIFDSPADHGADGRAVALTPDGKIVVGGKAFGSSNYYVALCRLTNGGELDTSFDIDGRTLVSFALNLDSHCEDIALQADGSVVVVGEAGTDTGVARVTPLGSLDLSFSGDGTGIYPVGENSGSDKALGVLIQPDGKIVVAGDEYTTPDVGQFVMRLLSSGAPDPSFSANGIRTYDLTPGSGMSNDFGGGVALSADGIVVAGYGRVESGDYDFAVARIVRDSWVIAAPDKGGPPTVRILTPTGTPLYEFNAFAPGFVGGVRLAAGDVNGDGVPEIFCGSGPGMPATVFVFDGRTQWPVRQIQPFGPNFKGGVYVAVADVLGSPARELIVTPGPGTMPFIRIFDPVTGALLKQIKAFDKTYRGGARVATGNVLGTPQSQIVVAAESGQPLVKIFNAANGKLIRKIIAFPGAYRGGLYVAAGNVLGTNVQQLIVGSGVGMKPTVRVFNVSNGKLVRQYPVFAPYFKGGVRLSSFGSSEIVVAATKPQGPLVQVMNADNGAVVSSFYPFVPQMTTGLFVAAVVR